MCLLEEMVQEVNGLGLDIQTDHSTTPLVLARGIKVEKPTLGMIPMWAKIKGDTANEIQKNLSRRDGRWPWPPLYEHA